MQFGDEPTKFFYAPTTERYRINTIISLQNDEGFEIYGPEEKAAVLWNTFRNRMGHTSNPEVLFKATIQYTNDFRPISLLNSFDRIRKTWLWRGSDIKGKRKAHASL